MGSGSLSLRFFLMFKFQEKKNLEIKQLLARKKEGVYGGRLVTVGIIGLAVRETEVKIKLRSVNLDETTKMEEGLGIIMVLY